MSFNIKTKKILHTKEVKRISDKIKTVFNKIIIYIKKNKYLLWMILPFALMEVFTFIFGLEISYINYRIYTPILFTLCWVMLFIGVSLSFKKNLSKIIYGIFIIFYLFIFIGNGIYFSMTSTFFDMALFESAGEGAPYLLDATINCNLFVYVSAIIILISSYHAIKRMPKKKKNNPKLLCIILVLFAIIHTIIPTTLGKANDDLNWSSWKNPRNIYILFNDYN